MLESPRGGHTTMSFLWTVCSAATGLGQAAGARVRRWLVWCWGRGRAQPGRDSSREAELP